MKKIFIILIAFNLYSYTLDFPGDVPPLESDPEWKDPTVPVDLNSSDDVLRILNELNEEKLRKLKQALDVLFPDDRKGEIIRSEAVKQKEQKIKNNVKIEFKDKKTIDKNVKNKDNINININ